MDAAAIVARADVLVVVGSSLQVWPAAGLVHVAAPGTEIHLVDPQENGAAARLTHWREPASTGVPKVVDLLRARAMP